MRIYDDLWALIVKRFQDKSRFCKQYNSAVFFRPNHCKKSRPLLFLHYQLFESILKASEVLSQGCGNY